jgi:hypothetical protein
MTVMGRKDSTLQPVLVEMWDSRKCLKTTSKTSPEKSTGVHGSLVGYITPTILQSKINKGEIEGGYANRFLWFAVQGKPEPVYDPVWINCTKHPEVQAAFDVLEGFVQPYEKPDQGQAPV